MILRKYLALAAAVALTAGWATAQEAIQDEGSAYRAWYEASRANDVPKAIAAAKAYLAQYAAGQYAGSIKTWLLPAEFDTSIKEKRTADALKFGRELLAKDPENLLVLTQVAYSLRNELLAAPPNFEHAADAVELTRKAVALIEAGKTPTGASAFDKDASLAWLTQVLAINEAKSGNPQEAAKLYEKSAALAPNNPPLAGRNLLAVFGIRQASYTEAVKAFKAVPGSDATTGEPKPEVKAALDKVNQEADTLIEAAAAFVAYAKVKNLAPGTRDRVNQTLEAVYKSRHPEDATLEGLQKLLQAKEPTAPVAPAPPATPGA